MLRYLSDFTRDKLKQLACVSDVSELRYVLRPRPTNVIPVNFRLKLQVSLSHTSRISQRRTDLNPVGLTNFILTTC